MINLFDPSFVQDPYSIYAGLRKTHPVAWFEPMNSWICTRYADVIEGLGNKSLSSGSLRFTRGIEMLPQEHREEFRPMLDIMSRFLLFQDGSPHAELRRRINPGFAPNSVNRYLGLIDAIVDELLDGVERASGDGPVDFVTEVAMHLPSRVICSLMGVEASPQLRECINLISRFFGVAAPTLELSRTLQASLLSLHRNLRETVKDRRNNPGHDLISHLVSADIPNQNESAAHDSYAAQCIMLLFGGEETTRNLIANGLHCLLTNPGQLEMLRNNHELADGAVREILRYEPPGQFVSRAVMHPTSIGGTEVSPGQSTLLVLAAANRDPEVIESPNRFDITRTGFRYLSFGYGAHACVGSSIAEYELKAVLLKVLERFSKLKLMDDVHWVQNLNFRGVESLVVQFTPYRV